MATNTNAATAKLSYSGMHRVTLKLKRSDDIVVLNRPYDVAALLPDDMSIYDADGDAVTDASFVDIGNNYSMEYNGARYHFNDPVPLVPPQQVSSVVSYSQSK